MNARVVSAVAVLALLAGCSKNQQPQQQPPPTGERITGNERLGWTQPAVDTVELGDFKYAIYVDGTRSQLTGVACSNTPGSAGFDCSAALPRMSSGAHTLEMAAYVDSGNNVLESGRSSPLQVVVSAATTTGGAAVVTALTDGEVFSTSDGIRLRLDVIASGLTEPTDLAVAPDGRLFVAERGGRIRVVRGGVLQPQPAVALSDVAATGTGGLLGIALDPRFDSTQSVYAIYTTRNADDRLVFTVARFREARDTLADRAVILDDVAAAPLRSAASLRFGADGKLYLALDNGGNARDAGDLASFNGKILRMNRDGTTPDDQAGATPVFSFEYRSPRGFDWQPGSSSIWIADEGAVGSSRLRVITAAAQRARRSALVATYALPSDVDPSAVAFYRGALIPELRGDLLIASSEGGQVLRIRFDPRHPTRVAATERLLLAPAGNITTLVVAPDGTIYFCTPHELARIVPAG